MISKPPIAPIEARLRAEIDKSCGSDWHDNWFKGLPEATEIPGNVNVREILRLWTYAKSLDLVEWGKMRYNLLGGADHWFPGKNAGELDERVLVESLASSPFKERIPGVLREAHEMLVGEEKKRLSES
jgi:predicted aldo/keto reductase-like oxidoreductase